MTNVSSLIPIDSAEWVFGIARSPIPLAYGDEPLPSARPDLYIWYRAGSVPVISSWLTEDGDRRFEASLAAAVEDLVPGGPRRPSRVRVADPAHAATFARLLGDTCTVVVAETPEIAIVLEVLAEPGSTDGPPPPTRLPSLEPTGGSVELTGNAMRALARLHRAAPWERAVRLLERYFLVDAPSLGARALAVRIAKGGGTAYALVYESVDALREWALRHELDEDDLDEHDPLWQVPHIAIGFVRGADLATEERRRIADHGWEVAGHDAFPRLVVQDDDGLVRACEVAELERAIACVGALASYAETDRRPLRNKAGKPRSQTVEVPGIAGAVTITGPLWIDLPEDRHERWQLAYDAHPIRRRARVFLDWHGPFDVEHLDSEQLAFDVLAFVARDGGRRLGAWTPAMIDAYFFEELPRCWLGERERSAAPAFIAAMSRWLEEIGEIDHARGEALRARIAERSAEYLAAEARMTRRARWIDRMEGAVPLPSAPCPCGSGSPYRDCCA